jgi:hypothetical protein
VIGIRARAAGKVSLKAIGNPLKTSSSACVGITGDARPSRLGGTDLGGMGAQVILLVAIGRAPAVLGDELEQG